MSRHLTANQKVDIIKAFVQDLEPMISIAHRYNKSRQGIWKVLKTAGVETSKQSDNTLIKVSCDYCQTILIRNRAKVRNQVRHFCNIDHYYKFIEINQGIDPYIENRHGCRIAREKVAMVFDLLPEHIVHHEDRNNFNNAWENLAVFACQGDHIRYHRLGSDYVQPIWRGDKV